MGKRKWGMLVACMACVVALLAVFGCGSQTPAATDAGDGAEAAAVEQQAAEPEAGEEAADEAQAAADEPEIRTVNGMQIQRTPTDYGSSTTLDYSYSYHTPEMNVPYNTAVLGADSRGCNACHQDLAALLNGMEYAHTDLTNDLGIEVTVQMCIDCHTFGYGYITNQNQFGDMIHSIHRDKTTDCWSCHAASNDGQNMELWDAVKHTHLRGITPLAEYEGDLTWDQDRTTTIDELFDFDWNYYDLDYQRHDNTANNVPLDDAMFDSWTITVSGAVNKEITYTLPELIEKFGPTDRIYTLACTLNPAGGPFIGNTPYTGISVKALLDEAGLADDAAGVLFEAPDGFAEPILFDNFEDALIAYESDGQRLPWSQGYPAMSLVPHAGAPASVKCVSDLVVITAEEAEYWHEWDGWPHESNADEYYMPGSWPFDDSNGYTNKPSLGIFDFAEGLIVPAGAPYTFDGYAWGYNENIAAIEVSLDAGATWTTYAIDGASPDNWVCWHLTLDVPEDETAYVMTLRAVTDAGRVSDEPVEVLFNAKAA